MYTGDVLKILDEIGEIAINSFNEISVFNYNHYDNAKISLNL